MSDPRNTYLRMKDDLQKVIALPLRDRKDLFRDFLVGYLMVECGYSQGRAADLVEGNEEAILVMLTEEDVSGLW